MLRRLPRRLGTALILIGVAVMPACYYAVSLTLRHEATCPAADQGCVAEAAFWRYVAIAGFVTGLAIGATGVILDRLQGRR